MRLPSPNLRSLGAICAGVFGVLPDSALASECETVDALNRFTASGTAPEGAVCATYLSSFSTTGVSCYWSHAYRSPSAEDQASAMWTTLTKCRNGSLLKPDEQVNHPDSYDLREWAHEKGVYAISIKDKAGQNRTLVFLRFEPGRAQHFD